MRKKDVSDRILSFEGGEYLAKLGMVEWNDACIFVKAQGQLGNTISCVAVGYVFAYGKTIFVVHNISGNTPDDFLAIPMDWSVKITYFRPRRRV